MNRLISWLLLLVLFGGYGVVVYQALRAQAGAGKGMPAYSLYSRERNGLAEAGWVFNQLGWHTMPVTRAIQQTRLQGLLILVEPSARPAFPGADPDIPEAEAQGMLRWVEQGNTLLLCGRRLNSIHRLLNVEIVSDVRSVKEENLYAVSLGETGGYTDGIDRLVVEGRDSALAPSGLPLWWLDNEPGAMLVRRGQGRVIVVPDPSFLTPRGLRRQDNVIFPIRLAEMHSRDGRIYFDEYHHGFRSGGGFWGYLHFHGKQWILLQFLLLAAMATWAVTVRLGPAVATRREKGADAVDYASAMARIYQRAGVRSLPAKTLARDFLEALTRRLGLRRSAAREQILIAWQRRHPGEAGIFSTRRLQELLQGLGELRSGRLSQRRLLTWAKTLDQFKIEVLRAG